MPVKVHSLKSSAEMAVKMFRTFEEGAPDLIKTGIGPLDRAVGGLYPGDCMVIGMSQGTGKSSLLLHSVMEAASDGEKVGVISLEDNAGVLGARAMAAVSGIDSLRIRRKELAEDEKDLLSDAIAGLGCLDGVRVVYQIGGNLDEIEEAVDALAIEGCRVVWVDYLQKSRNQSDDRRNDVSRTYTRTQARAAKHGMATIVLSQFSRQPGEKEPQVHWLKESGDIENEARIILLGWRDPDHDNVVHMKLAKCTFGGEGIRFSYVRGEDGVLRPYVETEF